MAIGETASLHSLGTTNVRAAQAVQRVCTTETLSSRGKAPVKPSAAYSTVYSVPGAVCKASAAALNPPSCDPQSAAAALTGL